MYVMPVLASQEAFDKVVPSLEMILVRFGKPLKKE